MQLRVNGRLLCVRMRFASVTLKILIWPSFMPAIILSWLMLVTQFTCPLLFATDYICTCRWPLGCLTICHNFSYLSLLPETSIGFWSIKGLLDEFSITFNAVWLIDAVKSPTRLKIWLECAFYIVATHVALNHSLMSLRAPVA